jgi:hypothetical protein
MQAILNRLGRDGIAGAAIVVTGLFGFLLVRDYPVGDLSEFGPGFVPWITTIGMALLGAVMVVQALQRHATETIKLAVNRSLVVIPAGMALFALGLEPLGIAFASTLSVFVSSFASNESRLTERILLAVGLAALVTLVFSYGLGMTMPRWPWFMRP